jgi:hypothetical protein
VRLKALTQIADSYSRAGRSDEALQLVESFGDKTSDDLTNKAKAFAKIAVNYANVGQNNEASKARVPTIG